MAQGLFKSYDDGSLVIGNMTTTSKYCTNDSDSLYLTALSKSSKYVTFVNNSLIIFSDSSNVLTITLTKHITPAIV